MAELTMPSSRATARRDRLSAPTAISCRRASSLISAVSSALARSRAVFAAFTLRTLPEHRTFVRAPLLTQTPEPCSLFSSQSTALESEKADDHHDPLHQAQALDEPVQRGRRDPHPPGL